MFKVGDKVVGTKLIDDRIFEYQHELPELSMAVISKDGAAIGLNQLRHATPEEIAAGHRIDNDMGDDSHIENHVSPLCKVTEANVDEALKLNRLG